MLVIFCSFSLSIVADSCAIPLIASRFIVGLNVGIPAALLVINRRLYKIASRTEAVAMKAEKLRAVYVDLAIGLSIPLLQMILRESTQITLPPTSDCCSFRNHC